MGQRTKNFEERILNDLKNPEIAASYLDAALDDDEYDPEAFLLALRRVAQAHGVAFVAKSAELGRESLYKALSGEGNPSIRTLSKVLEAVGMRLSVRPKEQGQAAA